MINSGWGRGVDAVRNTKTPVDGSNATLKVPASAETDEHSVLPERYMYLIKVSQCLQ